MNLGTACYHSVNLLSSCLLSKARTIKIEKPEFYLPFVWASNLVSMIKEQHTLRLFEKIVSKYLNCLFSKGHESVIWTYSLFYKSSFMKATFVTSVNWMSRVFRPINYSWVYAFVSFEKVLIH